MSFSKYLTEYHQINVSSSYARDIENFQTESEEVVRYKSVKLRNFNVLSLDGIQRFKNLYKLHLSFISPKLNDFSPLQNLTSLRYLNLYIGYSNEFNSSDYKLKLENIPNLDELSIQIENMSLNLHLHNLTSLKRLIISGEILKFHSDIATSSSIEYLELIGMFFYDYIPKLCNLKSLVLDELPIKLVYIKFSFYNLYKLNFSINHRLLDDLKVNLFRFINYKLRIRTITDIILKLKLKLYINLYWDNFILAQNSENISRICFLSLDK